MINFSFGELVKYLYRKWERKDEEQRAEIRALQLMLHVARDELNLSGFVRGDTDYNNRHINMLIGELND